MLRSSRLKPLFAVDIAVRYVVARGIPRGAGRNNNASCSLVISVQRVDCRHRPTVTRGN